jgi:hypothetical protein
MFSMPGELIVSSFVNGIIPSSDVILEHTCRITHSASVLKNHKAYEAYPLWLKSLFQKLVFGLIQFPTNNTNFMFNYGCKEWYLLKN